MAIKNSGWILIIGSLFVSCEKTIEFDDNTIRPMMVVNGILEPGQPIQVYIHKSRSIVEEHSSYKPLPDADVALSIDGRFEEKLDFVSKTDDLHEDLMKDPDSVHSLENSYFQSKNIVAESGRTYRLEIKQEGMDDVVCETRVPYPVEINELTHTTEEKEEAFGFTTWSVGIAMQFTDPVSVSNYYRLGLTGETGYEKKIQLDMFFGDYSEGEFIPEEFIPSDTLIQYKHTIYYISTKDPVLLQNERGNILGEGDYSLQFTDELFDGNQYTLTFNIPLQRKLYLAYGEYYQANIELEHLSRELYEYVISKIKQSGTANNPFAEPVPVYSNIEGGVGIFGSLAKSSSSLQIGDYPLKGKTYIPWDEADGSM